MEVVHSCTNVRYMYWYEILCCTIPIYTNDLEVKVMDLEAGLDGAIGCASNWRLGGCRFDPHRGRQYCFMEIDHSRPSADSRRAIVIFWRKNVHNAG